MIPDFNMAGVIPPIYPDQPGHSPHRSPYVADIISVIERFGVSAKRINILRGFLDYRSKFYELGIVDGFQWIDGSFCQDVESIENRDPNDIDVVTFFYLPNLEEGQNYSQTLVEQLYDLLNSEKTKPLFNVDAYGMQLGTTFTPSSVQQVSYWYSMWSHRKSDNMWKGFVQVSLSVDDDLKAIDLLNSIEIKEES